MVGNWRQGSKRLYRDDVSTCNHVVEANAGEIEHCPNRKPANH